MQHSVSCSYSRAFAPCFFVLISQERTWSSRDTQCRLDGALTPYYDAFVITALVRVPDLDSLPSQLHGSTASLLLLRFPKAPSYSYCRHIPFPLVGWRSELMSGCLLAWF